MDGKIVTVSVALLLAFSVMSLEAKAESDISDVNVSSTEQVAQSNEPTEVISYEEYVQRSGYNILRKTSFRAGFEDLTLYYLGSENRLEKLTIVPKNYKQIIVKNANQKFPMNITSPYEVKKLYIHQMPNEDDDFVGAYYEAKCRDKNNETYYEHAELKLPDDVANEIITVFIGEDPNMTLAEGVHGRNLPEWENKQGETLEKFQYVYYH